MRATSLAYLLVWLAVSAGCSSGVDEPPCEVLGCDGARLCELPADPAARGPWPVGARTLNLDGLIVEVWYPAQYGSVRGIDPVVYDVREQLPEEERGKVSDAKNPWQPCDCYPDLPPDSKRGPYPVVIFIHGTAGYRSQSLTQLTHWASRGFVVLAADHPGLYLGDLLQLIMDADLEGDLNRILSALEVGQGQLAFLQDLVDLDRVALSGHSAGGMAVGELSHLAGVRLVMPMAAAGVEPAQGLESVLVMGGIDDQVVEYARQQEGYAASPAPKRLVGISNAGHLVFSDMCAMTNAEGQDLVEIATEAGVTNASLAELLFDGCDPGQIDPGDGWEIVNYITAAALEESLQCRAGPDPFDELLERFELVGDFQHEEGT